MFQVGPFVSHQVANGGFVFWTKRDWSQKSCYGNSTKGVILFLSRWTIMVPSFKNTALIFLEILFFQYFTIFSCKQYNIITDLILGLHCHAIKNKNHNRSIN